MLGGDGKRSKAAQAAQQGKPSLGPFSSPKSRADKPRSGRHRRSGSLTLFPCPQVHPSVGRTQANSLTYVLSAYFPFLHPLFPSVTHPSSPLSRASSFAQAFLCLQRHRHHGALDWLHRHVFKSALYSDLVQVCICFLPTLSSTIPVLLHYAGRQLRPASKWGSRELWSGGVVAGFFLAKEQSAGSQAA